MKELKLDIDGVMSVHHVPENYDELSRDQLLVVCSAAGGNPSESALYASLTVICEKTWQEIPFPQRYILMRLFDFVFEKEPAFSKQLLPFIEVDGVRYIGYQPTFSNTTWEEFIYADGYMLAGRFREAAAVLYRPQRDGYTGETDRRMPFTIYGTDTRMKHFAHLPNDQLAAFVLCYKTFRKRNLEMRYTNVFARSPKRRKTSPSQLDTVFSWVSVHRDLMGDHFFDETKFYASNVHVILGRLDKVIREGFKR